MSTTVESERNNNESSGKCSQVICANQKRKLLQIILVELKLLHSKIRDNDKESKSSIKEVCDMISLLLSKEVIFKRFDNASFKPEDGKWYNDLELQTARAEKGFLKELHVLDQKLLAAEKAAFEDMVELKDLKLSKYKEKACDRCRQIAENLDSIESGDVQKSKAIADNQKSARIIDTNSINPAKSIDKTIPEKTPSKPPPKETKTVQSKTAPTSKLPKQNDTPKAIDKPVIVPLISNITPPKPHVPTNQDPKKCVNSIESKQVVKEKPKVPNPKVQTNHPQPHLPKSGPNPSVERKSSDANNSTIKKNPKKSLVTPPVTICLEKMLAVKIFDKEIANPKTINEKSKVDSDVNTATSTKVNQSSGKTVTSDIPVEHTDKNSLPSNPPLTKPATTITDSINSADTKDNEIDDPLSSGDERRKESLPKRKRKRATIKRPTIKVLKPADPDSDSSVSTTIGDTGESEEGNTFNLIQPTNCSTDSDESDLTTDCHNASVSEFDLMRDKWDGYIFQSDSDEENNLIEKEKRKAEYRKLDMGKYWIHPNSPGPLKGLKFLKNVLHRPKNTQQFWYFVPSPGERVRPKWVELDQENLSIKWKEAQDQPRKTFQKHLEKFCPASAINLDILDEPFDDQASDVAFLIADKFTEEQKFVAESDFYKLLYGNKNNSNEEINVFDPKKGAAVLVYDKRGDISSYKQLKN